MATALVPPTFSDTDPGFQEDFLLFQVEMGARRLYGPQWEQDQQVVDRLRRELRLIIDKQFAPYFLMLWLCISAIERHGIPVGPGRGSSGGSLVAYCLGITKIDPLKYDLLFERFLTEDRTELPDVDIDISQERLQEAHEIIRDLLGRDQTIRIGAFQRFGYRACIEQIGRVAGMNEVQVSELRGMIPAGILGGRKIPQELHYIEEESSQVRDWLERHPQFREALMAADGGYQHMTKHAAGILVIDQESAQMLPLASTDGETMVTGWDMYDIERLRWLKQDWLGLRTLDIIYNACRQVGVDPMRDIPLDHMDEQMQAILAEGRTLGVFQLEGYGYTNLCREMKPTRFEHIAALNALYRPGCLEAYVWVRDDKLVDTEDPSQMPPAGVDRINMVDLYVRRMNGRMETVYPHPDLEPILGSTYGIILYQEQAMRIAVDLAGFTPGEADGLRKAIGKKRLADMEKIEPKFIAGCAERGYDEHLARTLWDNIAAASRYSWNSSHSHEYGMLTYWCVWLKAHHPVHWFYSLLESYNDKDKIAAAVFEMRQYGIALVVPSINYAQKEFAVVEYEGKPAVSFGLTGIYRLGHSIAHAILAEREANGPFIGTRSFMERCPGVPIDIVESMICAGAFDELPEDVYNARSRGFLYANARTMKANTKLKKKQHPLDALPLTPNEMLQRERDVLGFFISGDPVQQLRENLGIDPDKSVVGTVTGISTKIDRNGGRMAWLTIDDPVRGTIRCTVFASRWANCSNVVKGCLVALVGRAQEYKGREGFLVDSVLRVI